MNAEVAERVLRDAVQDAQNLRMSHPQKESDALARLLCSVLAVLRENVMPRLDPLVEPACTHRGLRHAEVPSPILVWPGDGVPGAVRAAQEDFGLADDVDWVAVIPPHLRGSDILWMMEGTAFGCCSVTKINLCDGSVLVVGTHA